MSAACLIVSADDFGLTEGTNRAIADAHDHGILTSASLLACGRAFEDAVRRARERPALGVGVHLALVEGWPVLPPDEVPAWVDEQGRLRRRYVALLAPPVLGPSRLEQVRREWRAQIQKVMDAGLPITHLDSHKHLHMHPQLLKVALALAGEHGIRAMRLSRPPRLAMGARPAILGLLAVWARWRAKQRGIRTPDALLGLEASGRMTTARLLAEFRRPWRGVRELMMHPAYPDAALKRLLAEGYDWIAGYRFEEERAALCDPQVRATLARYEIKLVSYAALALG